MTRRPGPRSNNKNAGSEGDNLSSGIKDKMTIYVNPDVIKRLKHRAIEEDKTFSELVQRALELYLQEKA